MSLFESQAYDSALKNHKQNIEESGWFFVKLGWVEICHFSNFFRFFLLVSQMMREFSYLIYYVFSRV